MNILRVVTADRLMYDAIPRTSRDVRIAGLVRTGTDVIAMFLRPAWMIVSSVYE